MISDVYFLDQGCKLCDPQNGAVDLNDPQNRHAPRIKPGDGHDTPSTWRSLNGFNDLSEELDMVV